MQGIVFLSLCRRPQTFETDALHLFNPQNDRGSTARLSWRTTCLASPIRARTVCGFWMYGLRGSVDMWACAWACVRLAANVFCLESARMICVFIRTSAPLRHRPTQTHTKPHKRSPEDDEVSIPASAAQRAPVGRSLPYSDGGTEMAAIHAESSSQTVSKPEWMVKLASPSAGAHTA